MRLLLYNMTFLFFKRSGFNYECFDNKLINESLEVIPTV